MPVLREFCRIYTINYIFFLQYLSFILPYVIGSLGSGRDSREPPHGFLNPQNPKLN